MSIFDQHREHLGIFIQATFKLTIRLPGKQFALIAPCVPRIQNPTDPLICVLGVQAPKIMPAKKSQSGPPIEISDESMVLGVIQRLLKIFGRVPSGRSSHF